MPRIDAIYNDAKTDHVWPVVRLWQWAGEIGSYFKKELPLILDLCERHNIRYLRRKESILVFAHRKHKFASFDDFLAFVKPVYFVGSYRDVTLVHDGIDF